MQADVEPRAESGGHDAARAIVRDERHGLAADPRRPR